MEHFVSRKLRLYLNARIHVYLAYWWIRFAWNASGTFLFEKPSSDRPYLNDNKTPIIDPYLCVAYTLSLPYWTHRSTTLGPARQTCVHSVTTIIIMVGNAKFRSFDSDNFTPNHCDCTPAALPPRTHRVIMFGATCPAAKAGIKDTTYTFSFRLRDPLVISSPPHKDTSDERFSSVLRRFIRSNGFFWPANGYSTTFRV